jgi:hypothetical protein
MVIHKISTYSRAASVTIAIEQEGHPGVYVMIAIVCDFSQISAKKWRFS